MDPVHDRGSMDPVHESGPWTRSMKVVHGPGPKWGSKDPWSIFCPHSYFTCMNMHVIKSCHTYTYNFRYF